MPALGDVNFLLALCYGGHIHHMHALSWLDQQSDLEVILCRNTQLGLLRLLTNPTILGEHTCTQAQAWMVYDAVVSDGRFEFMPEPEGVQGFLREYSSASQISPKAWQDAFLAAFARAAGLRIVTFDRGFRRFDGLQVIVLG
jgi:hypothetical protein